MDISGMGKLLTSFCKFSFIYLQVFLFLHSGMLYANNEFHENQIYRNIGVVIYDDKPEQGFVDSYHNILTDSGFENRHFSPEAQKVLYLMRLYKTQNLLRGRKALLELLPPSLEQGMYRTVPREVKNIFLNGREILSIKKLVDDIELGTESSDQSRDENRTKVFKEMAGLAMTLNYIDKSIKFIVDEIWKNNDSFERIFNAEYAEECPPVYVPSPAGPVRSACITSRNEVKTRIIARLNTEFGISDLLEQMMGYRLYILNSYPILGVRFKDHVTRKTGELYSLIYKRLRYRFSRDEGINIELPNLSRDLDSNHIDFNDPEMEFSLPDLVQEPLKDAMELIVPRDDVTEGDGARLMQRALRYNGPKIERVYEYTVDLFDRAIVEQLEGNEHFLKELNARPNIDNNKDPYMMIAVNERNWEVMASAFPWANTETFEGAKAEILNDIELNRLASERRNKIMTWVSWGLFGIALLLPVIGSLAAFGVLTLSATVVSTLFAAGTVTGLLSAATFAAQTIMNHLSFRKLGKLSSGLFIGTRDSSDYQTQYDSRIMADRSVTGIIMIGVISVLFLRGPLAKIFGMAFNQIARIGEGVVRVSSQQLEKFRRALSRFKQTIIAGTIIGRRLIAIGENALIRGTGSRISSWLNSVSRAAGKSKEWLKNFIRRTPYYEKLTDAGTRQLWRTEMFVEFLAAMLGEYLARGENFWREFGFVLFNTIFALGITTKIVFSSSSRAATSSRLNNNMWDHVLGPYGARPSNFRARWGWNGFFGAHLRSSVKLGIEVGKVALIMNGLMLMYRYIEHLQSGGAAWDEDVMELGKDTLITTLTMVGLVSVISPAKAQLVYQRFNRSIDDAFGAMSLERLTPMLRVPLSMGNNVIGTFSLASALRALGVQGGHGGGDHHDYEKEFLEDFIYIYNDPNKDNAVFLYPHILNEDVDLASAI